MYKKRYIHTYLCMYIYVHVCLCMFTYIYIYMLLNKKVRLCFSLICAISDLSTELYVNVMKRTLAHELPLPKQQKNTISHSSQLLCVGPWRCGCALCHTGRGGRARGVARWGTKAAPACLLHLPPSKFEPLYLLLRQAGC